MKTLGIGNGQLASSRLAYGCWRIAGSSSPSQVTAQDFENGKRAIVSAYEYGYSMFDNADIYSGGIAEKILGEVLKEIPGMRKRIVIVTKCGVRRTGDSNPDAPYRYDFSSDYIINSCEGSLKRLGIETIDIYLLHRPDYLCNPYEVAEAFDKLYRAGKVRGFGVSNFSPSQLEMLQKYCPYKLLVNQIEISLLETSAFEDGRLDQCIKEQITPMAWSPLAGGIISKSATASSKKFSDDKISRVCGMLDKIAKQRNTTRTVIALSFLLKHPSHIIPIVGTTNPERIRDAAMADDVQLTREEWYSLLEASRGSRLP
ncbi:MAG TPA: aldo/keto reductase [Verrucomicrobiota bacterium]|nr:aldo/keto reductase [Verrucomicrobiota bacterium]